MRRLATLVRNVPGLQPALPALAWPGADRAHLDGLAASLGWGRITTRVPRWAGEPISPPLPAVSG